jgi:hypothetical protein
MEDFYFYSCVVALVVLILMLTMIGITISYGNQLKVFPPSQNACPDYWEAGNTTSLPSGMIATNASASEYCRVPATSGTNTGVNFLDSASGQPEDWDDIKTKVGGNTQVTGNSSYYIRFSGNDASWNTWYPGLTPRCAKRKWALDNSIVWDGISNFNGCT